MLPAESHFWLCIIVYFCIFVFACQEPFLVVYYCVFLYFCLCLPRAVRPAKFDPALAVRPLVAGGSAQALLLALGGATFNGVVMMLMMMVGNLQRDILLEVEEVCSLLRVGLEGCQESLSQCCQRSRIFR